ncbi:MAG: efflux RND transporter periplasmic adaptor subunit [Bacteroidales bacterium]
MKPLFSMIVLLAIITSCGNTSESERSKLVVKIATAKVVNNHNVKKFSFITQPHHTVNLSFKISGQVKQFNVYSGNYFKQGDLIAKLDDRDYIIQKERSEGLLYQAKAEYERIKNLYEKNNISASTFDKAYADYITAKTAYESANNGLIDTELLAPFSGYVNQVYIEQYQDVKSSQSILSMVDIKYLRIEVYVSQEIAMRAKELASINLHFDAVANKVYQAKVVGISQNTTDNNLSYLLTALLPNPNAGLLPGMSGEVIFDSEQSSSMVIIPQIALAHRPIDGDYVWCVDTTLNVVSKRKVKLGRNLPDGNVEVKEFLNEGERVAISSLRFLTDGISVNIQP